MANYAFNDGDLSPAGVSCWGADCTINNSILWANSSLYGTNEIAQVSANAIINYSTVMVWTGTMGGIGNTGDYPFFVDLYGADNMVGTEDDDLRLAYGSPCIDAADNTAVLADVADLDGDGDTAERTPLDLGGNPRFVDDPDTDDTGMTGTVTRVSSMNSTPRTPAIRPQVHRSWTWGPMNTRTIATGTASPTTTI